MRWLWSIICVLLFAFLLLQLYFFLQIAAWSYFNPNITRFMIEQQARLQSLDPPRKLKYQWVSYKRISPYLKKAVITSEDSRFAEHEGIDWDALEKAYEKNLRKGKIVAGGSTISQQLAKNLFLTNQRSYLRKGQEVIITYMLEFWMSKQRIFEIYLNVAEWGDGIFGIQAAAQHYYGVSAKSLTPWQAARLAAMLPNPRFYDKNRNSYYLTKHSALILRRMSAAELP